MGYYPVVMDLSGRKCLIVGGGEVALRKALSLTAAGGLVTVIAPEVDPGIEDLPGVDVEKRSWLAGDSASFVLVFAATNDRALNASVSDEARANNIPVNVVDDPELCSFIVPACVTRGDLMIAVTSSGKSPALSKKIRRELEARYGVEYSEFIDLLGELRDLVKAKYSEAKEREAVFNRLMDCGILELLSTGQREKARKKALECI